MADDTKELWTGFLGSLMLDVEDSLERQRSEDKPTNRRGLIRALITAVEGLAWVYRGHVIGIAEEMDVLTNMERVALAETTMMVDDTGRISEQKRYLSAIAMIRLTTRIAKNVIPDCDPDFGSAGWSDLKETFALRNRITHPKHQADLGISDNDISCAISAFHWFIDFVITVMTKSNQEFRSHVQVIGEIADLLKAGDQKTLQLYREISGGPAPGDLHNP